MNIANRVFWQVVVMLMLIGVGALTYKVKIFKGDAGKQLSNFLLMVVNPALIIHSYQRAYDPRLVEGLLIAFGLALVSHIVGIAVSCLFIRRRDAYKAVERFAVVYSNCGFMAIPLIGAVLGEDGVFFSVAYITVFNLLNWTHGVFIMEENHRFKTFLEMFLSPTVIGIVIGMLLFFLRITLPTPVSETVEYIALLNTPLAMLITGISLAEAGLIKTFAAGRAYYIAFLRLLLIPAVMIFLFKLLPVPTMLWQTNLLATVCPTAASTILFANRFGKDAHYASRIVTVTTVLSIVTIPLVVWFAEWVL